MDKQIVGERSFPGGLEPGAIESFLSSEAEGGMSGVALGSFVLNFILSAFLAYILGRMYVKYGNALSNRELFSRNFVAITVTTMFIITIVKSSVTLSLGLVGALSIIRFRTAIKEPEELVYLFVCVAIGLGLGSGATVLTIIAFLGLSAVLGVKGIFNRPEPGPNLYVTFSALHDSNVRLPELMKGIKQFAKEATLKRFDDSEDLLEASFQSQFSKVDDVERCVQYFRERHEGVRMRFLDDRGIGGG